MTYSPTPLNIMSLMLLGSYDTDAPETALVGYLADSNARCVKVENSGKHMHYAAKRGLLTIGRNMARLEEPLEGQHIPPSAAAARIWYNDLFLPWVAGYGVNMKKVFFEGCYNEPGQLEDPAMRRALNDFEVERQTLMAAGGYRCCIFNFSAEANVYDKLTEFLQAIRLAHKLNNLFGQHSYGSPVLVDIDTGITETAIDKFVFPEEYIAAELRRRGEPVPMFANTEHGIDKMISLGRNWEGWRTIPGLTGEHYFRQLVVTCQRKKRNGLVKAVAVFVDDTNPGGDWVQYNTHGGKPARPNQGDPGEPPVTLMIGDHHSYHPDAPIAIAAPPTQPPPIDPVPPTKPTPPYEGTTTRALNARLGTTDSGYFLKELPTGTPVKVIGYSPDGRRAIIETSILADGIRPK